MTCRTEGGATYKQDYNAENKISSIYKMDGDCATGTVTKSWLFAYDGDGVRTATSHFIGITLDSTTSYYFGGAYEITGSDVTKYYSFGGQTIMRDGSDELQYFLTDHLGSTVAITDDEGTLTSQQRYLPFGGIRTDLAAPEYANLEYRFRLYRTAST